MYPHCSAYFLTLLFFFTFLDTFYLPEFYELGLTRQRKKLLKKNLHLGLQSTNIEYRHYTVMSMNRHIQHNGDVVDATTSSKGNLDIETEVWLLSNVHHESSVYLDAVTNDQRYFLYSNTWKTEALIKIHLAG